MTPTDQIATLHAAYCELTGFELGRDYARDYAWHEFVKRGFTLDDLKMVVFEVRKGMAGGYRFQGSLKFRNLIEDLNRFEEDLAEARANLRNRRPPPSAKERVLEASGRPASVRTGTARTVETVVSNVANAPELTEEGKKAREAFSKLKEQLK